MCWYDHIQMMNSLFQDYQERFQFLVMTTFERGDSMLDVLNHLDDQDGIHFDIKLVYV